MGAPCRETAGLWEQDAGEGGCSTATKKIILPLNGHQFRSRYSVYLVPAPGGRAGGSHFPAGSTTGLNISGTRRQFTKLDGAEHRPGLQLAESGPTLTRFRQEHEPQYFGAQYGHALTEARLTSRPCPGQNDLPGSACEFIRERWTPNHGRCSLPSSVLPSSGPTQFRRHSWAEPSSTAPRLRLPGGWAFGGPPPGLPVAYPPSRQRQGGF
jgi:hypothetical protein